MALSQDEQRILAEIERRLGNDDPGLASSLTAFRRPGPAKMLRHSPRVRIVGSLFAVLLVAMVSLTVYAMIPFRAHLPRQSPPTAAASASTALSAATSSQPSATQQSSASLGSASGSSASQVSPNRSAAAAAASKPQQQGKAKPTSTAMLPTANP
jgi:cytoskeletal protein RodZ